MQNKHLFRRFLFMLLLACSYLSAESIHSKDSLTVYQLLTKADSLLRYRESYRIELKQKIKRIDQAIVVKDSSTTVFTKYKDVIQSTGIDSLMLSDQKLTVIVDSSNKKIYVSESSYQFNDYFNLSLVKKAIESANSCVLSRVGKDYHLSIKRKSGEIDEIQFVITDEYIIKSIRYQYRPYKDEIGQKVKIMHEIVFKLMKLPETENFKYMSVSSIVRNEKNRLIPSPEYKKYHVQDLRVQ